MRRLDEIVRTIGDALGKPDAETLLNDVLPALDLLKLYETSAPAVLRTERRAATFLFQKARFHVEYHPRGVVLVLAPANLPFQLALSPTIAAFTAGNAVVCKVSERTPWMAGLLRRLFDEAGVPHPLVSFLTGDAALGEELVRDKPDLVFLTGSAATGRRVAAIAAETVTPVLLELGGKDPAIVFADAPFERAVNGVLYGAFANAGQLCVAAQRVYVERAIFERFVAAVVCGANALRFPPADDSDYGALASEPQAARFRDLINEALAAGARLHTPLDVAGRIASPAVLTNVPPDVRIMREETFGPAMAVTPFDSEDDALQLANDSVYGLNASIWTSDLARGRRVGSRLETGSVAINDVLKNIGNPHMPFGGIKASGIGVYHGPEGLRAFSRPLSVMVSHARAEREPNWFPYSTDKRRRIEAMIRFLYGGGSALTRLRRFTAFFGGERPERSRQRA